MDKSFEEKYLLLEEKMWWFFGRRDMLLRLIRNEKRDKMILDIGCSGGSIDKFLIDNGFRTIFGIDNSKEAISSARIKKLKNLLLSDAVSIGVKEKSFDIIICSDVLEHIENDSSALNEWYRILKSGGRLILFVPAFKILWSGHDVANHHKRRYEKKDLIYLVNKTKFFMKRVCFWNFFSFLPLYFLNQLRRNDEKINNLHNFNLTNIFFKHIIKLENMLIEKNISFPFGASLLMILEKK